MDDTISRQAAIDTICRVCQGTFLPCESFPCDEIEALNDLPPEKSEKNLLTVKCEFDDEELRRAIEAAKNAKLELIAAQQEQRWIPCGERLPELEIDEDAVVSVQEYFVTVKEKWPWEEEWKYNTDIAEFPGDYIDDVWQTYNDWREGQEVHVIAWMPLPKPYKEGEQDG